MLNAARIAIPVIVPRALVLWGLTRLAIAVLSMPMGQPFGAIPTNSISVVLLSGVIGLIDVRVRGERILWANLGARPGGLCAIYAAAAILAECALALAL